MTSLLPRSAWEQIRGLAKHEDAERPMKRSHAERGNEIRTDQ
jgi:hypothetical protein